MGFVLESKGSAKRNFERIGGTISDKDSLVARVGTHGVGKCDREIIGEISSASDFSVAPLSWGVHFVD